MMTDSPSNDTGSAATPIFILGVFPRCGTNFLHDLLQVHPDCGNPAPIWEDYFVAHVDQLLRYLHDVSYHWAPGHSLKPGTMEALHESFGGAIVSFLASRDPGHRVVTKTPRVDNLSEFPRLFPNVPLLILVRDGRNVVESGIKTFGWHRGWAVREWARAAQTILAFDDAHRDGESRYLIVRYEDLWNSLEPELRRILGFLGLDASRYDFEAAKRLPIKGSSTVGDGGKPVHWKPVEKTPAFDPMSRWRHWHRAQHERFNWIAGEPMRQFGYPLQECDTSRRAWTMWNRILDLPTLLLEPLRPILGPAWGRFVAGRRRKRSGQPRP